MSKELYREEILSLLEQGMSSRSIAKKLIENHSLTDHLDKVRKWVRVINDSLQVDKEATPIKAPTKPKPKTSEAIPFVMSAWNQATGLVMDMDQYCAHYSLPKDDVVEFKLVSHTGTPFYNIRFKERLVGEEEVGLAEIKITLERELTKVYQPKYVSSPSSKEGAMKWSDLHFGAHIRNLLLTPDYDSDILSDGLLESVREINSRQYLKTHVHILGDLIESFSGLNHINSWMSMNKDEVGSNAVMLCCNLLHNSLKEINNLGKVMIVGGNHDRLSKNNDEDVKGGAAELIAWGLKLMGYDVEFHPYILTHKIDGVNHILLHGDKGISKKATKNILWDYGLKGCFNFIFEGHLHTIIEKLSVAQLEKFDIIKDDGVDHRRMHVPSFFPGNYYSETLGYNSSSGYVIVDDNGKGRPNVFTGAI